MSKIIETVDSETVTVNSNGDINDINNCNANNDNNNNNNNSNNVKPPPPLPPIFPISTYPFNNTSFKPFVPRSTEPKVKCCFLISKKYWTESLCGEFDIMVDLIPRCEVTLTGHELTMGSCKHAFIDYCLESGFGYICPPQIDLAFKSGRGREKNFTRSSWREYTSSIKPNETLPISLIPKPKMKPQILSCEDCEIDQAISLSILKALHKSKDEKARWNEEMKEKESKKQIAIRNKKRDNIKIQQLRAFSKSVSSHSSIRPSMFGAMLNNDISDDDTIAFDGKSALKALKRSSLRNSSHEPQDEQSEQLKQALRELERVKADNLRLRSLRSPASHSRRSRRRTPSPSYSRSESRSRSRSRSR